MHLPYRLLITINAVGAGTANPNMENEIRNIHPGEILGEEYLKPLGMTPYRLARNIGLTPARVGEIVRGERNITVGTSLRLAAFFGTSPEFWLNMQRRYDLVEARQRMAGELARIQPYRSEGEPAAIVA